MDLRLTDGGLFSEGGADYGGIVALAIKFDRQISFEQFREFVQHKANLIVPTRS